MIPTAIDLSIEYTTYYHIPDGASQSGGDQPAIIYQGSSLSRAWQRFEAAAAHAGWSVILSWRVVGVSHILERKE